MHVHLLPPVSLLLDDAYCLVALKPGGLSTQAPAGIPSLEAQLKDWLKVRDALPGRVYLGVPHRLDRPVSGPVLFARHTRAARKLSRQFERRQVGKTYWAFVAGRVFPEAGTWTDFMRKIPDRPQAELVPPDHGDAQQAILDYRVLHAAGDSSLLEITLHTGRMHQIRLQAASRGNPVLGDALYGSTSAFGPETEDPRARLIALHGRELRFVHPGTQQPVRVVAPLPQPWQALGLPTSMEDALPVIAGPKSAKEPLA